MELLTPQQAWRDFDEWISEPHRWQALKPADRNRIRVARHAADGKLIRAGKVVGLGDRRLRALLEKYAPDRYTFEIYIRINL